MKKVGAQLGAMNIGSDMKRYTLPVNFDEQTEDYFIQLPEDLLEETGWKTGDTLKWEEKDDGTITLSKKETAKSWVLVETVSTFRMRYMVEVPEGKADWALDTVVMEEAKEFSQDHIGENILSHRVVSEEEAIALCDQDNKYCVDWSKEKKMGAFFTREEDLT